MPVNAIYQQALNTILILFILLKVFGILLSVVLFKKIR